MVVQSPPLDLLYWPPALTLEQPACWWPEVTNNHNEIMAAISTFDFGLFQVALLSWQHSFGILPRHDRWLQHDGRSLRDGLYCTIPLVFLQEIFDLAHVAQKGKDIEPIRIHHIFGVANGMGNTSHSDQSNHAFVKLTIKRVPTGGIRCHVVPLDKNESHYRCSVQIHPIIKVKIGFHEIWK